VIQLQLLNGSKAGQRIDARRFPFQVGRSAAAGLSLEDDGVWDCHLKIELHSAHGAVLRASPEGFTAVNGQAVKEAHLRNGDIIEAGSVKILVGFSPVSQRSLRFREWFTWVALGALCLGQVALVYWLAELG
jgi:hypothetical protein